MTYTRRFGKSAVLAFPGQHWNCYFPLLCRTVFVGIDFFAFAEVPYIPEPAEVALVELRIFFSQAKSLFDRFRTVTSPPAPINGNFAF